MIDVLKPGGATGQTFELYEGRFACFKDTRHRGEKPRFVLVAEQRKLQKLERGAEAELFYRVGGGGLAVYEKGRGRSR